ncbi:hypothetical protein PVAP13_6KG252100 [Panicum virgatum]|uniref:Flavin-containing monooxygenase n=1 Tax=Panicum virgatum TaxID=38727 RepID=A0A8T0RFU5_PANVG|nr:hypothetical protein PVAP13_6KG252100 [Panicum virgatum]
MEYSRMAHADAEELIRGKRVIVVGSGKSGVDIVAQCAQVNGSKYPCTMVDRHANWAVDPNLTWAAFFEKLMTSRLAEMMVRKPGEGLALHGARARQVADSHGDRGVLQGAHADAGARDAAGPQLLGGDAGLADQRASRQVLRHGRRRRHRAPEVRRLQLLRRRRGPGLRRRARRRRRGHPRHRLRRRPAPQWRVRVAPVQRDRRRAALRHHAASLQAVRAAADTADGGGRVCGERGEHLPLRDDGQVGGAPARRRGAPARRGGHGAERGVGAVGAVGQAAQRRLLPQVVHRHHDDVVPRPAVPGHGGQPEEEEGGRARRRLAAAVRAHRLRRHPVIHRRRSPV